MNDFAKIHHVGISVANLEESVNWYGEHFGFEVVSRMTVPHNGTKVAFIGNGNFMIELLEVPNSAPLPSGRSHPDEDNATLGVKHLSVAVKGAAEFVEKLGKKGVAIVMIPEGLPFFTAFINDNTGNIIEITEAE